MELKPYGEYEMYCEYCDTPCHPSDYDSRECCDSIINERLQKENDALRARVAELEGACAEFVTYFNNAYDYDDIGAQAIYEKMKNLVE